MANPVTRSIVPIPAANLGDPIYQTYIYQAGDGEDRVGLSGVDGSLLRTPPAKASMWLMHSPGPEAYYYNLGGAMANSSLDPGTGNAVSASSDLGSCLGLIYDPTNGTVSSGAIWRNGGATGGDYSYFLNKAIETQK